MDWDTQTFLAYLADARMLNAAAATLAVATAAQIGATLIGFVVALGARSALRPVVVLAACYVWLFRGLPPLLLLLLFYFGLPQLGLRLSVLEAGLLGLSLYAAAYMAEILRSALASVDSGQIEAARAMGLSRAATMRCVILPQAIRIALPAFGNEYTSMMRTTSLLSVISFEELLRVTTMAINQTFRPLELYAVASLYYLAMTTAWMAIQSLLEHRPIQGRIA
jgi:polar amino acid transport system permease protein